MAENTTEVVYKALADFSALHKATIQAKKDIKDLQKAEDEANAKSLAGDTKVVSSKGKKSQASKKAVQDSLSESAAAAKAAESAAKEALANDGATSAKSRHAKETSGLTSVLAGFGRALSQSTSQLGRHRQSVDNATRSTTRAQQGFRNFMQEIRRGDNDMKSSGKAADTLGDKIKKALSSRSQLGGLPFAALIPIIGALISAINPLIALLGAGGAAAIGFANSLGSLAGAALALPGILSAVASGIASMMVAFSGFGGVFKAAAQQKAAAGGGGGGGGGGGQTQADRENQLAQAQDRVARSQRSLTQAQKDLNKARQQAIRDLQDLQKAVARAGADEQDAIANLEQAQQDYNNILADSGSTKADKDKAASNVTQAQQALEDVRTQNIRNTEDLADAQKKGIEGSDQVVQAQNQLTDALSEQRDALYALQKAQQGVSGGGGGGGGGGLNVLQAALDKLSPSARAFAEGLLAMSGAWHKVQQATQEAFFSHLVQDLPLINGFLPTLQNLLVKSADAMGGLADKAIKMVTSGPWTADFATIADQNAKLLTTMGDGALYLLDAFRNLIIAAGPFTQKFVQGIADGAKHLSELVENGRKSGALAAWLEKVSDRISTWWSIVKNVAKTLFNYGSAASAFGDWITDGLKRITEGWLSASEAAKKPNSSFKKWLDDVKPLVSEVRKVLGDFFGWLGKTSADPKNINTMKEILDKLDTKLGPAIGDLLKTFADLKIPQTLIDALTSITEAVNTIMKNGGSEAANAFLGVLEGFFGSLADFAKTPGGGAILTVVAGALGTIAALSIVGKFTGVTGFLDKLINVGSGKNPVADTESSLTKIAGLEFTNVIAAASAIAAIAAGAKGLLDSTNQLQDGLDKANKKNITPEQRQDANSEVFGVTNRLPIAGIEGLIKLFGGKTDGFDKAVDKLLKPLSDMANGGKEGAATTPEFKWNLFSNPTGGGKGLDIGKWFGQTGDFWSSLFGGKKPQEAPQLNGGGGGRGMMATTRTGGSQQSTDPWANGAKQLGDIFGGIKIPDFGKWLDDVNPFKGFKMPDFGKFLDGINPFKGFKMPDVGKFLDGINPFKGFKLPDFGGIFKGLLPNGFQWPDFAGFFKGLLPGDFKWPDFGQFFKNLLPGGFKWPDFGQFFKNLLPGGFKWPDFGTIFKWQIPGFSWPNFGAIFGGILPAASTIANNIYNAVANAFSNVGGWLRSIFGNKGGQVKAGRAAHKGGAPAGGGVFPATGGAPGKTPRVFNRGGGVFGQYLAAGGRALEEINAAGGHGGMRQIGTDTIPAMLTPGEFVLRKGIVDTIGMKNLQALNEGLMSYSDLLNMSMANQKNEDKQREKNLQILGGFGLAGPTLARNALGMSRMPQISQASTSSVNQDHRFIVEKLEVNNAKPESASDSLPRAIRSVSYVGGRGR